MMRPSLKPRNLAISTGDFFSGKFEREQIERERERERKRGRKRWKRTRHDQELTAGVEKWKKIKGIREGEKKVTPEKKSMRIAISELSSEPRAIDVRRKPILVEQEEERERERERERVKERERTSE